MIPADLASRLRLVSQELPQPVQPVTPARQLTDILSDLSTGQKILAQIQAQLPNGAYRAVINQQEIVLALPFSAKAGDSIELEVKETEGKLSLAFIANHGSQPPQEQAEEHAVASTLSKTGNLISTLLAPLEKEGILPEPTALNGNRPILQDPPTRSADIVPALKEALSKSGMFYESHQAQWVAGKLPLAQLKQEPQGQLTPLISPPLATPASIAQKVDSVTDASSPEMHRTGHETKTNLTENSIKFQDIRPSSSQSGLPSITNDTFSPPAQLSSPIAQEANPIVQQQLNALSTQNYVWSGQIWPGQTMDWEISEDDGRPRQGETAIQEKWQTRLKLELPHLGTVSIRIGLDTQTNLSVLVQTPIESTKQQLQNSASQLQEGLHNAGLRVSQLSIAHARSSD